MRPIRMVVLSDLHCGHFTGLTPPSWHDRPAPGAPRKVRQRAKFRRVAWKFFSEALRCLRPIDLALVLGDAIDGEQPKQGGAELIATDRQEQVRMAVECLREVQAKQFKFVYGSAYHVGNKEDWENDVAGAFGKDIGTEQDFSIRGLHFNCKHFIGSTTSTASRFTALSNEQIKQLLWAEKGQQPKAHIMLRGHIHRHVYCGDESFLAAVCPALQGLGGRIARKISGLPLTYGLMHFDVASETDWQWAVHVLPLSVQAAKAEAWG